MVTKWSKKRALDLSLPPFCTKFRHDSHGSNGFVNYESTKNPGNKTLRSNRNPRTRKKHNII